MSQILNLTEADFTMLIDALEHLPNKDDKKEIFNTLFGGIRQKPENVDKYFEDRRRVLEAKEEAKKEFIDDIKILQGKLLVAKRELTKAASPNEQSQS